MEKLAAASFFVPAAMLPVPRPARPRKARC